MGYYYHFISKQTKTVSLALYHGARRQVITWACRALRRIIFLPVYNYICLRLITCVNLSRRPLRRFYWLYFKRRGAQRGGRPHTVKNKLTLGACACVCVCRLHSYTLPHKYQELTGFTAIMQVYLLHTVKVFQDKMVRLNGAFI